MKKSHKMTLTLSLSALSLSSAAFADHRSVQTAIESANGLRIALPTDGSNCDPLVIKRNLDALKRADVLEATNLTLTTAHGNCYGACQEDLEAALEKHCAKADVLADLVASIATRRGN